MNRPVTLAITGDVMLGRLVNTEILRKGFDHPWGTVLPALQKADLCLINLECAITSSTQRWHNGEYKAFYFGADPIAASTLRLASVDFASLANNHICDFGATGLNDTVATLDQEGIAHAGAGTDLTAARAPALLSTAGMKVAVVAFADYPVAWAATKSSPGINYTPVSLDIEDFQTVESEIRRAQHLADVVIFSIHWGPNMRIRPTQEFQSFARRVIEAGSDIFWGHSAHLVQGVEIYQGKPILYDTGDFVDDYAVDDWERNDLSALFLVRTRPTAVERVDVLPVQIHKRKVDLAAGPERKWFMARFTRLCAEMGTPVETSEKGGSITAGLNSPSARSVR